MDYETRAEARLDAAVRKTLEEGKLGADAATPPLVPGRLRAGRAVQLIAVHGDGNVIHVGFGAPPPSVSAPGARPRAASCSMALSVMLAALALLVALLV